MKLSGNFPLSAQHACSGRRSRAEIAPFLVSIGKIRPDVRLKVILCLLRRSFRDDFRTMGGGQHFAVVSNFFEGRDGFRSKKTTPTIFFVLSRPVLYDRIFCFKPVRG